MKTTIDARMLRHSGIGTYLQALLPAIKSRHASQSTIRGALNLIVRRGQSDPLLENVPAIRFLSPVYAPTEQLEYRFRVSQEGNLLWIPHFNAPLCWRGRLVVTIHDLFHFACEEIAGGAHKAAYAQLLIRHACCNADAILCVSHFTASELRKYTGAHPGKIHVIPNGVSEEWFRIERKARPVPFPYFLYVGNIKPHKNLVRLIQAYRRVSSSIPQHLVIVGKIRGFSTGDRKTLREACELPDRIHLVGPVDQDQLHQLMAYADALVFPSLYEGFGLPPLEAMACGCPTLVSRAGAIPEVCADAALYFDPLDIHDIADNLSRIAHDPALREELSRRGIARAKQFDWASSAAKTLTVLDMVQKTAGK